MRFLALAALSGSPRCAVCLHRELKAKSRCRSPKLSAGRRSQNHRLLSAQSITFQVDRATGFNTWLRSVRRGYFCVLFFDGFDGVKLVNRTLRLGYFGRSSSTSTNAGGQPTACPANYLLLCVSCIWIFIYACLELSGLVDGNAFPPGGWKASARTSSCVSCAGR